MSPKQYWKIDGEVEHLSEIPSSDKYVQNLQWHCSCCGEIWARAIFLDRLQLKGKWNIVGQRPCQKCGGGSLLDQYTLSRLDTIPIPLEIYEREFLIELRLYDSGWPCVAGPYHIGEPT